MSFFKLTTMVEAALVLCAHCTFAENLKVGLVDQAVIHVICRLPGETPATVVIGGHFDFAEEGAGIVDDCSGASLLPSLFAALKTEYRKHTFEFVAFSGEERGLAGSARFLKDLSTE